MILDGRKVSTEILNKVEKSVVKLKQRGITPGLAVVLAGGDSASRVYVNNKKKACSSIGIYSEEYILPSTVSRDELLDIINKLNNKKNINGILLQLPIPKHLDEKDIIEHIYPEKDVDSFNFINSGKLMQGKGDILPCTPSGIMEMLKHYQISVSGRNCVIVGRSNIVGKPMAMLMLQADGTVTICHSKTRNIKEITKNADIIVSAVGKPGFITADMVKDSAVIIDVGMNRNSFGRLCGDVDFESVSEKASYITPVPGGVGPMTIAMLMKNTVKATCIQNGINNL